MTRKSGHITTPFLVFLAFQIEDCYKVTCSNKAGCYKVSRDTRWRSECESILENPKGKRKPVNSLLFFFFFWLCHMACRILVPWSGIEPAPLQWKHWVLTTGLQGSPLNSLKVNAIVYDRVNKSPPFLQMSPMLIQAGFTFPNRLSYSFMQSKGDNMLNGRQSEMRKPCCQPLPQK